MFEGFGERGKYPSKKKLAVILTAGECDDIKYDSPNYYCKKSMNNSIENLR